MQEMIIKDVNFNGDILRAAQDENGTVWVGVRWVCKALGMSDSRLKHERLKLQQDEVFSHGIIFCPIGKSHGNKVSLLIMLDYLPLWLAKINITPTMKKDNPQLADKLLAYQLNAKDVLAKAFIDTGVSEYEKIYKELAEIRSFQELFYKDMGNLTKLITLWMERQETDTIHQLKSQPSPVIAVKNNANNDYRVWKDQVYTRLDKAIELGKISTRKAGLIYLYDYMTRNYGVVWDQVSKDFYEETGKKVSTIDLIFENKTYKSIFDSILDDLCEGNLRTLDDTIRPLIEKRHDNSNCGMRTWAQVYKNMEAISKTRWNALGTRYRKKNGHKNITKKELIEDSKTLRKRFDLVVNEMLEEMEG